jgi:hypothetical protein
MAVSGLASLTALALAIGLRSQMRATTTDNVALVIAQTLTVGACLIAVSMLLREQGRVPGIPEDVRDQGGREQKDRFPSAQQSEDRRWLNLVEALVALLDELERHRPYPDLTASDLAEHIDLRVQEILERAGVTVIAGDTTFDRNRHQPEPPAAQACAGALIQETLRPGLAVGRRVFRRARVRLATSGTVNQDQSPPNKPGQVS